MNLTAAKSAPRAPVSRQSLRVLVVDDDAFQLKLITAIFHELDIVGVTTAASGEQALQHFAAKQTSFHLMLLDLHMPGMDGFKFMESLAKVGYTGALIIVSGQSEDVMYGASMVAELRRFTLLGTLPKPVSRAALSALINDPRCLCL
jgi:CheY-like chemotaxis protein